MTPYGNIFKILFKKFSPPHRSTLLCSNAVEFIRRKKSEIVRYSPDKKKQNFRCLSNCRYSLLLGSRPKSAWASSEQCVHSALHFIQIGSLSAELEPNASTLSFAPAECCHNWPEGMLRFGRIMDKLHYSHH